MTEKQRELVIEVIEITFDTAYQNSNIMTPPWTWGTFDRDEGDFADLDYEANEREIDKLFELELKTWRYKELVVANTGLGYSGRAWKLHYKIPTTIPEFYNWIRQEAKENSHHMDRVLKEIGRELFDYQDETGIKSGDRKSVV